MTNIERLQMRIAETERYPYSPDVEMPSDEARELLSDLQEGERLRRERDELQTKLFEQLAFEAAFDSMGVYPQANNCGPNAYEKRTEWMEGWNAHGDALLKKWMAISRFDESLPLFEKQAFRTALLADAISCHVDGEGKVEMAVKCNDLFWWGCADAEPIAPGELVDLAEVMRDVDAFGSLLWCCRKREMRPQGPCYKSIPREFWPLFDACGPEREDSPKPAALAAGGEQ